MEGVAEPGPGGTPRSAAELLHELNNALFAVQLAVDNAVTRLEHLPPGPEVTAALDTLETALDAAVRAGRLTAQLRQLEDARGARNA